MDSYEVRREWLRQGGSASRAARVLGMTRQNIEQHVARADRLAPLSYQKGERADREAMAQYVRACLDRACIAVL